MLLSALFNGLLKPGGILVECLSDLYCLAQSALGELVIRQNFNGSSGLYERLGISEGILKQSSLFLFFNPVAAEI